MILVTGGTGLVGAHLLYKLVHDNTPVRATYRTKSKLKYVKHVWVTDTEESGKTNMNKKK